MEYNPKAESNGLKLCTGEFAANGDELLHKTAGVTWYVWRPILMDRLEGKVHIVLKVSPRSFKIAMNIKSRPRTENVGSLSRSHVMATHYIEALSVFRLKIKPDRHPQTTVLLPNCPFVLKLVRKFRISGL